MCCVNNVVVILFPSTSHAPHCPPPSTSQAPRCPPPSTSQAPHCPPPSTSQAPHCPPPSTSQAPHCPPPSTSQAPHCPPPSTSQAPHCPPPSTSQAPHCPPPSTSQAPHHPPPSTSQAPHCPPPSTCTSLTGTKRDPTLTGSPTPHHNGTSDITEEPVASHDRECDLHNGDQQCVLDTNCRGTRDGNDCSICRVHGHSGTTCPACGMPVIVMLLFMY